MSFLNIDQQTLNLKLESLERIKLIEKTEDGYRPSKKQIFLPRDANFINAFHTLSRSRAWSHMMNIDREKKNNFSLIYTCSEETQKNQT